MTKRFFSSSPIRGKTAVLTGPEAHHLKEVMRIPIDDTVTLFDGSGEEFSCRVVRIDRNQIELSVLARQQPDRELARPLIVAAAMPKRERMKWMVEKLTELGVSRLIPLKTARSIVTPGTAQWERLQRVVIEASKQCERNHLMEITPTMKWDSFLNTIAPTCKGCFGDCQGMPFQQWICTSTSNELTPSTALAVAIGPEGGLTPEEQDLAQQHGWTAVSLGSRTLRIETAAVTWTAACAVTDKAR